MSDNPSRWMSPSSMAGPAARSGAPGRTGSRRGVTSSSCAPRARVSAPSSGREGTVPLLPRRRTRSCARGEPNLAARARALPLLPLSFLGWGVPSRPPAPRRIPAGTALAPPRAAQLRAVSHPTPDTERGASERPPGTLGTNSRALPGLPPASPPRARLHRPRRAGVLSVGLAGGPAGKAPRWGRGIATQPRETEMMAEQARAHAPAPSPPGGRTPIHPFWMCQRGGGEALAWQGELEVTGQAAASI